MSETARRTTDRRVPPPAVPPLLVGTAIGVLAAYLVAGEVFRWLDVATWRAVVVVAAHALTFATAATALVVGRRAGARWLVALSLAALLFDPLRLLVGWSQVPRAGAWLSADGVALSGVTVVLALGAAAAAWRMRQRRVSAVTPVRPWLVGMLAAAAVLSYGTRAGFDPGVWPWLTVYAAVVGLGAAAIPTGVYGGRRWLSLLGWLTVGALPVLHSAWFLDAPDPEAWSVVYLDLGGFALSGVAGLAVAIGLVVHALRRPAKQGRRCALRPEDPDVAGGTLITRDRCAHTDATRSHSHVGRSGRRPHLEEGSAWLCHGVRSPWRPPWCSSSTGPSAKRWPGTAGSASRVSDDTPVLTTIHGRSNDVSAWEPADVYAGLDARPEGLTADEARHRLTAAGPNVLEELPPPSLLRGFVGNVTHLMALLLWAGGLLALLAELPQLAIAVWTVNLINGAFSTWQEHRAERAIHALRGLLPTTSRVLRDGLEQRLPAEELVPGDVLLLGEGDRISADARLVGTHEFRVDQSALTGESRPVRRTAEALPPGERPPAEQLNRVFAGTLVTQGRGKAVVTATGMHTEFGVIADLTHGMPRELSPLQRELATLSRVVGIIAIAVGVAFFALAQLFTPMPLDRGLVFALGMIVAFVPEGLLPTVTLSLAIGTQRMARRQALVKRLSAVEALGSTTVICTDKTGTLTANQMTVRAIVLGDDRVEVSGTGYAPVGGLTVRGQPVITSSGDLVELLRTGVLANDARVEVRDDHADRCAAVGDPTEAALLVVAAKAGLDQDGEGRERPRVGEYPFDTQRKRMSTLHREEGRLVLRCKGAPRELLDRCGTIRTDGVDRPLDETTRARVLAHNDELSREAMRVLGFAVRELPESLLDAPVDAVERDLTWCGMVGMLDPPREAVAEAVATCRRAGIRILMITGDYGVTAESIARRIGLVAAGDPVRIVNGDELDHLDDEALRAIVATSVIFARATPAQKLRIVAALQTNGEVVAVTGDGVNDAPALKRADIGVAMGASGTDVAREAADIVLLDDDFASIVAAVEEGRAVYANARRFTGYIFTSNTPEAVPFMLFGLSGGRIPIALDVMHILAVDLGTDLVPALGLGAEPPEPGVMDRPPRRRDEHLITPELLRRSYLWLGPAQAAVTMAAFLLAYRALGVDAGWLDLPDEGPVYAAATAAALTAVVATQIGNLFAHRTDRASIRRTGWGGNRLLWIGIASELAVIVAIVYLPPLQAVIGTAAFPAWLWLPLLATAPLLLVIDEVRKAAIRRRARGLEGRR